MTDNSRAGHHFALAGWNFAEELVKETGAKLALPSCYIYVFIVCLNASALKNTKPVSA